MSEADFIRKKNKWLKPLSEWVAAHGGEPLIPFSGTFENKVGGMPDGSNNSSNNLRIELCTVIN